MLEAHGHRIGGGVVVVGIRPVEVAGSHPTRVIERRGAWGWRGVPRQTDGRNTAVRRVVLGDMQIVQVQTVLSAETKRGRWRDAVTLIFDLIAAGIMGFFAHQVQPYGAGFADGFIDIERTATEPGAASTDGGIDTGIQTRLFADHVD